jgi:hypothetical protein
MVTVSTSLRWNRLPILASGAQCYWRVTREIRFPEAGRPSRQHDVEF